MQNLLSVSFLVAGLAALSHGQRITIPGGQFYDLEQSDLSCLEVALEFQKRFFISDCAINNMEEWNKYRGGFVGSFFPEIKTSVGLGDCTNLAGRKLTLQERILAQSMCNHISGLRETCACDRLRCANDRTNGETKPEELSRCSGFSQKMCLHFSRAISTSCSDLINKPPKGAGVDFDYTSVPRNCDEDQCRSAATSIASRGVYLATALVTLAFAML